MLEFSSCQTVVVPGAAADTTFVFRFGLEEKLTTAMRGLSSDKFERVLHPIFEEVRRVCVCPCGLQW